MAENTILDSLQAQMASLAKQVVALQAENFGLRGETKAEREVNLAPKYMVMEPGYYSPDDIYYPAGAIFEDLTGRIIPNECMEPQNASAERNMRAYLNSLPMVGATPPLDLIVEAAMQIRPKNGDEALTTAEFQGLLLQRALELKAQKQGLLPRDTAAPERQLPKQMGNVPIMSNTRISGSSHFKAAPMTKLRSAPVAPADKEAAAMGTSRSQLIGSHTPLRAGA